MQVSRVGGVIMRNIFLFIRTYFNFLFFLALQVICLIMLFRYNKYHNAVFMGIANEVTGKINKQYSEIDYYLHLKKTNDSLMKANERLYNKLKENYMLPDSATREVIDTIRVDSLMQFRRYIYREAKVVSNSTHAPNNYLQIYRGSSGGIKADWGVIDQNGAVVGTVISPVSENFSTVMSLLHKNSSVSARHKKSGKEGSIYWDGKDPEYLMLKEITKSAVVKVGDTIVTSGLTTRFPYGLSIGTVAEIIENKTTNNYLIKVKTAADFSNTQFVFVIENLHKPELEGLLKEAKKGNE